MSKVVYHYCSVEAFNSIISESTLRFGNIRYMNDGLESIWIAKVISDNFDKYTESWEKNDKYLEVKDFIKNNLVELVSEMKDTNKGPYVCCFAEEADSLSQWRGYGDDGYGVALGIDIEKLVNSKCHRRYNNDNNKYYASLKYPKRELIADSNSGKVIYLDVNTKEGNEYIENSFKIIKSYLDENKDIREIRLLIALEYISNIKFKNPYFKEEKEYRVECDQGTSRYEVTRPLQYMESFGEYKTDIIINGPHFYVKDKKLKEYFEVDFSSIKEDVIKKIYLGPKCCISKVDILNIFKSKGYKNINENDIIKSEGSYR